MQFLRAIFFGCMLVATSVAQQVTFSHQAAQNGQKIWQHVTVFANTMTTYEQDGSKISRTHNYITKEQIRRVTILEAKVGPEHKVQVTYEKAQETRNSRGREAKTEPQTVNGKTYVVMRPDDELLVFDPTGQPAEEKEAKIVRENMQFVGRPNPLAKFLSGKTINIGTPIRLPDEVAQQMLGWKESYGRVDHVTITLKSINADRIATFDAEMVGAPIPELKSQTKMSGELHVSADSCRTTATNLKADLAVHETRGPQGHTFTVSHEGQANIHTQARLLTR